MVQLKDGNDMTTLPLSKVDASATLLGDFQLNPAIKCVDNIKKEKSTLLLGGTGTGKTFIVGEILRQLKDENYLEGKIFKVLYLTPGNCIKQTSEVLKTFGLTKNDVLVMNYDQLRSNLGEIFITWKTEVINGAIVKSPYWDIDNAPSLIVCDECQKLKNENSLQTQVMTNFSFMKNAKEKCSVLFVSATPAIRPRDFKCIVTHLRPNGMRNVSNWRSWIHAISHPFHPDEYAPSVMKRIAEELGDQIVRVENVSFPHKAINKHKLVDFEEEWESRTYRNAYEDYLRELARTNRNEPGGIAAVWVAIMKFRQAADMLKVKYLVRKAINGEANGKNIIMAFSFLESLDLARESLIRQGIDENKISIITGRQNFKRNNEEKVKFQKETTHFMLMTSACGGVGLSLQNNKYNKRPREIYLPPVWRVEEMLQVLGRAHRIDSISTSRQFVMWFRGTVEEEVMKKVQKKALSLKELIGNKSTKQSRDWTSIFIKESLNKINNYVNDDNLNLLTQELIEEEERIESKSHIEIEGGSLEDEAVEDIDMFDTETSLIAENTIEEN